MFCDLFIEHRRHGIQIFIEEVRVNIESHGRCGVAPHSLHGFQIRSSRNRKRCCRVPKVLHSDFRKR